ncbi:hypothetical protein KAJ87_03000 [Candidatus Pacearchaeota archaeon]|nr:hypothetical protein [Candidatus Pacearchaeota archaeon]
MEGVLKIGTQLIEIYKDLFATFSPSVATFLNFMILVLMVVIYSIFIWKFYRFVAKKNILGLDLNKYNKSNHPLLTKFFAGLLYLLEYIIILPFFIFIWFSVFTLFLVFLTELEIQTLLIISATIIAAIRMTSYYKENLSKDLAKLLPLTLLAVSIINPGFFDVERILSNFSQIPQFFSNITYYLIFIFLIEIILRLFDFIFSLFGIEEKNMEEETQ